MVVGICGGRSFGNYKALKDAIVESGFQIDEIVSGGCSGADYLGERYAKEKGIPLTIFFANWKQLGAKAGPARNERIAKYLHEHYGGLITLPGGKGTDDMVLRARNYGLRICTVRSTTR